MSMEPTSADLQSVAATNQDGIQAVESSANLAHSFQALFASSDTASQLQLLQAMGAVPHTTAAQMVLLPASVGSSSVMTGSWPQQYVVVPGLNQFVLAASDASASSSQAVLLASLGAQTVPSQATTVLTTSSPLQRSLTSPSPAHLLNGVIVSTTANSSQPTQLSQLPNLPKPPVKPLSAYMSFSKAIWPRVKLSHANASVCEIGAIIGHMWNDLDEAEKKRYNDNYAVEKAKYTKELQAYLQATGLKASDLVKPRSRKGRLQGKSSGPATVHISQPGLDALPHFSQVWSGPAQISTGSGQMTFSPATTLPLTTVCSESSHSGLGVETELRDLREAVSNVTREAEFLKRELDEAFAYIRQLEEQQASVMTDLVTVNSAAAASVS